MQVILVTESARLASVYVGLGRLRRRNAAAAGAAIQPAELSRRI